MPGTGVCGAGEYSEHIDGSVTLLDLLEGFHQRRSVHDVGGEAGGIDAQLSEVPGQRIELGLVSSDERER